MSGETRGAARRAGNSEVVEKGARLGYAANGVINLVIAWIALQLAWGAGAQEQASASGALQTLAGSTVGRVLLWVIVAGFALLALWQITEAFMSRETKDRVKAAGKAAAYGVLAALAASVIAGSSSSGGSSTSSMTARLMAQPFGRILVAAVGLGIVAVGVYHIYKGWKKKFLEDLTENPGHWAVRAGQAGYIARGVAIILVGVLFIGAAVASQPQQAQGLDAALQTVQQAPYGRFLLTLVALGFAAYGVYSFARAKYAQV